MGYVAFAVFGVGMAFIHFVWNLGPVAFARGQNPLPYTSTHAALVGLRASVGFPIGYALTKIFPGQPVRSKVSQIRNGIAAAIKQSA